MTLYEIREAVWEKYNTPNQPFQFYLDISKNHSHFFYKNPLGALEAQREQMRIADENDGPHHYR